MSELPVTHPLTEFLGLTIVIDTQGPLIYLGTLAGILPHHLLLTDTDVHDSNDSRATKDLYLTESRTLGVRMNRKRLLVAAAQVASISLLADIID